MIIKNSSFVKSLIVGAILVLFVCPLSAQSNIIGVRGGFDVAYGTYHYGPQYTNVPMVGYKVGLEYERNLIASFPLYVEFGLQFIMKGNGKQQVGTLPFEGLENTKYRSKEKQLVHYLQVPLGVNYKFDLGNCYICPSVGLFYAYAISMSEKEAVVYTDTRTVSTTKVDLRSANVKTSDLGFHLGLEFIVSKIVFGVEYEPSFLNFIRSKTDKALHNTVNFYVGYNFGW